MGIAGGIGGIVGGIVGGTSQTHPQILPEVPRNKGRTVTAIILPADLKNRTVIAYTQANGVTVYEVLDSGATPHPKAKRGERLEAAGENAGTIITFTEEMA